MIYQTSFSFEIRIVQVATGVAFAFFFSQMIMYMLDSRKGNSGVPDHNIAKALAFICNMHSAGRFLLSNPLKGLLSGKVILEYLIKTTYHSANSLTNDRDHC
jgi:hypothetical protein